MAQSSVWRRRPVDVTGLYNIGVRPYDPVSGRWLTFDPTPNDGDPNGYTFCAGGDPENYFDPDGRLGKNWVETAQADQSSDSLATRLKALPYGVAGAALSAPFRISEGFRNGGNATIAEADQKMHSYSGWRAVLARTAWFPNEIGIGLTKTVYTPVDTVAGIPQGISSLGSKIGSDVKNAGANPSVNNVFDIGEDAFAVWGITEGGLGLYRGASGLAAGDAAAGIGLRPPSGGPGSQLLAEYRRFRGQGFTPTQARYLTEPYPSTGMGHHFIPRRMPIPDFIIENPLNIMGRGMSRGRFYERHFLGDSSFFGTAFPRRIGGIWSGNAAGLTNRQSR